VSVKEYEKLKNKQMKPEFLDMVPWYSGYALTIFFILLFYCFEGAEADFHLVDLTMLMTVCCRTSADLFKTVFDLLVSVTVFLGRFDMRMMQV
jgi:hypothetical protein